MFLFVCTGYSQQVCARVRLEINQDVAIERQAFEATMTINNGLADRALTNVNVDVLFQTLVGQLVGKTFDPNNTTSAFFLQLKDNVALPTTIAASSSKTLKWLIIPTAIAGGTKAEGIYYNVGATLKYTANGKEEVVIVEPDSIRVLPAPDLILDYFLTRDVPGDDPFTQEKEPSEPFALGLRVINAGYGPVQNLTIESGQPKIVRDIQGLQIGFRLESAQVNEESRQPSLLVNFGALKPNQRSVARWQMTCSLTGYFSDFKASFSHASALGGQATSLIKPGNVRLHSLVREVVVDLPGRDARRDFLGSDETLLSVFETDNVPDSDVDQIDTTAAGEGAGWAIPGPPANNGFTHIRVQDPMAGVKELSSITRADGKRLLAANAWLSKVKEEGVWHYYVNVFETNNPGGLRYIISYGGNVSINHPPELVAIPDQIIGVGQAMALQVVATDFDGTVPTLSTNALPIGSSFTASANGRGTLTWTPTAEQTGRYTVTFRATDGFLTTTKATTLTVTTGDRLTSWKSQYWPGVVDANIIGNAADPDRDGINNLLEYAMNLDPTTASLLPIEEGSIEEGGNTYLTLTYLRRTDDPTLVTRVFAGASTTGPTWELRPPFPAGTVDQTGVPAGMVRVRARDSVALESTARRRFMKVEVEVP